jgi:hypothetical protein
VYCSDDRGTAGGHLVDFLIRPRTTQVLGKYCLPVASLAQSAARIEQTAHAAGRARASCDVQPLSPEQMTTRRCRRDDGGALEALAFMWYQFIRSGVITLTENTEVAVSATGHLRIGGVITATPAPVAGGTPV